MQFMRSQRVGQNLATKQQAFTYTSSISEIFPSFLFDVSTTALFTVKTYSLFSGPLYFFLFFINIFYLIF